MNLLLVLLLLIAGFVVALIIGLIKRLLIRLTLPRGTVIAEYGAPQLLSAAELGYLYDKQFGTHELLATVTSLVGKDLLSLTKHENNDPLIVMNDKANKEVENTLTDGEIAIYSWLKQKNTGTMTWQNVSSLFSKSVGVRAIFEDEVHGMLVDKGFLKRSSTFSFKNVSGHYAASAVLLLLTIVGYIYYASSQVGENVTKNPYAPMDASMSTLFIVILGGILWLPLAFYIRMLYLSYYYAAGQPVSITPKFRKHWRDIAGFELFIRTVEFSRLQADTNPYDDSMPYAIALGFEPDLNKMTNQAIRR